MHLHCRVSLMLFFKYRKTIHWKSISTFVFLNRNKKAEYFFKSQAPEKETNKKIQKQQQQQQKSHPPKKRPKPKKPDINLYFTTELNTLLS